ncbi:MAG: cupin domain-containing protein [Bacteroidales bacterium]
MYIVTINNFGGLTMFTFNQDIIATNCEPGVTRKILSYSEELMMCEITFEKDARGNVHSHPHLQITYVANGSFEFMIDGETKIVKKGDSVYMPTNAVHGVHALEDNSILVDVFNPMREDFLK